MEVLGITGASGFIGNNVVRYFADRGYKIIAFGRNSPRNFKHENVEWQILDLNDISPQNLNGIEKLIHFAGAYTAQDAFGRNVSMLRKVLDAVSQSPVKHFYMISTYAIFGDRETPADINAPYNPIEAYAMSKVLAEEEFKKTISSGKVKGTIIRPCSLYGPYGRNFVDVIAEKIRKDEPIEMVHFRNQFLHVDDFSEVLEKLINIQNPESSYNIEGEIITEEVLKNIFDKSNIPYSLHEQKVRSYLCKGVAVERKHNVEQYLTNIKEGLNK